MPRTIAVDLGGKVSTFDFQSVNRVDIYGTRRRIALDATGKPCGRASLTMDGSIMLRAGMTGQGYFMPDGAFVKQALLEGFDASGAPLPKVPSTLGTPQALEGPVSPESVLDTRIASVYALTPQQFDANLKKSLESGDVYQLPFNYRDDYMAERAFLLANDVGIFLLVGVGVEYEWSSLTTDLGALETDVEDDSDLDFEMM
jgi:hypothetical protein